MGRGAGLEERAPGFRYGRGQRPWLSCGHAGVGAGPNSSHYPLSLHTLCLPSLLQLHSLFFCSNNLLWGTWAGMSTRPSQSTDQKLG